jgi:hypothetical protein
LFLDEFVVDLVVLLLLLLLDSELLLRFMTDWVRLTGDKGTAELGDGELLLILLFELEEKLCDFVLIGVVLLL